MRLVAVLLAFLAAAPAAAQSSTGVIDALVTDQAGQPLASATVTVTETGTGLQRTLTTDAAGRFAAPDLPFGTYEVTVVHPGHATLRQEALTVRAGETSALRLELRVARAADTIMAGDMPTAVEPRRSAISTVVSPPAFEDLPVDRRSLADFAVLTSGVMLEPLERVSVAGLGDGRSNLTFDGADALDIFQRRVSLEAVQDMQVNTATYAAEYGRAAGPTVNVVTKSGTNALGGSAFDFFGGDANRFGGLVSGPLARDRHFFLANYEGWRGDEDHDMVFGRTDHNVAAAHRLAFRYNQAGPDDRWLTGSAGLVLAPTLLNEARVSWLDFIGSRTHVANTLTFVRGAHTLRGGVDLLFEDAAVDDHAAFVQNTWQASEAVTVNTGLRFEDGVEPRLGVAWSPGRRRYVLRAGYGLFDGVAHQSSAGIEWQWVPNTTVSASVLSIRADDLPGTIHYNGVLAELHRRLWQGVHYRLAYTVGKATDESGATAFSDRRQRFSSAVVYTTDAFAERMGGLMEDLFEDFTLSVLWGIQSGRSNDVLSAPPHQRAFLRRGWLDTRIARRIEVGGTQLQVLWEAFNLRDRRNYFTLTPPVPDEGRVMQFGVRFSF